MVCDSIIGVMKAIVAQNVVANLPPVLVSVVSLSA
jgi:hypothetical protein